MKKIALILAVAFSVCAFLYGEGSEMALRDVFEVNSVSSPQISPYARKVLYLVEETDWEENTYRSQAWLVDVRSGEKKQLTFDKDGVGSLRWSPDEKFISFSASRGEEAKTQVWIMPSDGGEARAATCSPTGVKSYRWCPGSQAIAYTDTDDLEEEQKKREEVYGKFEFFEEELNPNRLRVRRLEGGDSVTLVSRDDLHVGGFEWKPDGSALAFSASPEALLKSSIDSDIFTVDVETKEIKHLVNQPGPDSGPIWSPGGEKIAFSTSGGTLEKAYFLNTRIAVIPSGGGEIRIIDPDFDEDAMLLEWFETGIYFSAMTGVGSHLFSCTEEGEIKQLTEGPSSSHSAFSFCVEGRSAAFLYSDSESFPEVCFSSLKEYSPVKLTVFGNQLSDYELAGKEMVTWKSQDGTEITGVLITPADFDPARKYPLFVVIHGGPTGISRPSKFIRSNRYYPIEQFCARGAVVLMPNYRGSAGFGEAFRSLNYRNLGVGDYWDVISGVDSLIEKGFVDPEKVCSMGWSQGGYISAYITTFSDRFRAVSVGAGISDWVDYYYRTDITPFCPQYLGATPWDDPQIYAKTSPMTYINSAQTPTLIQHGSDDARVPINNAYKLYRGLSDKGVPVKFAMYKGFGHGISKPKEQLAVLTHNWQWFSHWVWGDEMGEALLDP
ncbi:MAG: S9 family peptidase, partial [Acidobacteriota bacterium]